MSQVDEIKNNINIVDVVSETVKLRRAGKSFTGFCPFHANTHTPAFVVFPDSGTWRCFGACAEGGDVISFIMKRDNLDFHQALEVLARRAGIQLEKQNTAESRVKKEKRDRLLELLSVTCDYFHQQLLHASVGKKAQAFLGRRGVKAETIAGWKLGYSLDSWDALTQHLLASGYSREEVIEAGVVSEQRNDKGDVIPNGRFYDRFRNRLMIPIRDPGGRVIGFGARILNPTDVPKFLNSPQTLVFDKGKTLFGYDKARAGIRAQDCAVIVEGYLDVIILHQAGFTNTVASMGTALTPNQVRLLTRQSKRIVLALDADDAGENATLKGIDVIRETVRTDETSEQSLIRQENTMGADIRVTKIPDGQDPDEVVLRDPAEWETILANAKPIITFRMEAAAMGKDLNDAKVKSEIAEIVMPLIEEVSNLIERETYRQQLASFLKIDDRLLVYSGRTQKAQRPQRRNDSIHTVVPVREMGTRSIISIDPKRGLYNKERTLLWYLVRGFTTPDSLARINRVLRLYGLDPVGTHDFEDSQLKQVAGAYFDGQNQDAEPDLPVYMQECIQEDCMEVFTALMAEPVPENASILEVTIETVRVLAELRRERIKVVAAEVGMAMKEMADSESMKMEMFTMISGLNRQRQKVENLIGLLQSPNIRDDIL